MKCDYKNCKHYHMNLSGGWVHCCLLKPNYTMDFPYCEGKYGGVCLKFEPKTEKEMKTTLSIEESARLIELGVDAKLASEVIIGCDDNNKAYREYKFSLTDILSILPKEIESEGEKEDLNIVMDNWGALVGYPKFHKKYGCAFTAPELIDALYQLAIYCLENNHIKTEKK